MTPKEKKAMYIGSFDPFTLGHLSIVNKALKKYDKLIICVGKNDTKNPLFSTEERKKFIELAITNLPRTQGISVITSDDLTVNIARRNNVTVLIRGTRSDADMQNEQQLAETNRMLAGMQGFKLSTDFIKQEDTFLKTISSSLVRSLLQMKEYIALSQYLPQCIATAIITRELKPLFSALCKEKDLADYYWKQTVETYSARPYHNLGHLAYMFNMLSVYKQNCENNITSEANLHLAIFLHDYVYHSTQAECHLEHNERDSAYRAHQWYTKNIFIKDISPATVHDLIMATAHSKNNKQSELQKLIADLDLSILGTADPATWKKYNENIRKEYKKYSDEEYKKGRLAFLFSLLKKKTLYHTKFFRNMLGEQAQTNIVAEIKRLHSKS